MGTTATPIVNGDQYRDGAHDVNMGAVYQAEAILAEAGVAAPMFRIACFSDARPPDPRFDVPVEDYCVPQNPDGPPATGTGDLQLMGRMMAMQNGFQYGGQYIDTARANAPTAVQISADAGKTWLWVSDIIANGYKAATS